ncbi:MAG: c-type cytochrome [bacterium]
MKRAIIFYWVLILFALTTTKGGAQNIALPNDPLGGQKVFVNKGCVNCHALFGKGGTIGRDLGKTQAQRGPAGIVAMMWNHSPEMSQVMQKPQEMPIFSEQEMADLIAFIYFLNYLDEPGDAEKGRLVLQEKKCLTCHKIAGKGGQIAPALDTVQRFANPLSLAQNMWNHGTGMSATMTVRGVDRPTFEGSELVDLFTYLRQIGGDQTDVSSYLIPGKPGIGEKLFEKKGCFNCHKVGQKGHEIGPDLTQVKFHLGVTRIAEEMWNHGPKIWTKMAEMAIERPTFDHNELADLVAYLYYLSFIEQRGNVEAGKLLFGKKGCVECHAVRGLGGNVAADLASSEYTLNYISSATAMWNHNRRMRLLMEKVGVAMPRFNEQEMQDLLAYLRNERLKNE